MKCVGAADPPCARCLKAGRKCEFPVPGQSFPSEPRRSRMSLGHVSETQGRERGRRAAINSPRNGNHNVQSDHGSMSTSYDTPRWTPITPETSAQGAANQSSRLPSVYSTSAWATVVESRPLSHNENRKDKQQPSLKRQITGDHVLQTRDIEDPISERDMEQLVEM
jgi:hypothetical protein